MLGICQWFHYEDHQSVTRCVDLMRELNMQHLRTGLSWADFHRPAGREWYQWQMEQLAEVDVLLSIWHTPPSIAEGGVCAGPPRRLLDFADFVWEVIQLYGDYFNHLELWNEPNNRYKWDFHRFDPDWAKFAEMIAAAAKTAKMSDVPTVLGGMIPVDHHWLNRMESFGALEDIDVVAIHGFPGMWWPDHPNWDWHAHWHGWDSKIAHIAQHAGGRPIWITEAGLATWGVAEKRIGRLDLQSHMLQEAARAPAERTYWYSLVDLDPQREAIEGFHEDENEYHLGLVTFDGEKKPAFETMRHLLRTAT